MTIQANGPSTEPWTVSGSYFEACNCEAICPCRSVGDAPGGASDEGVCDFALSWHIDSGRYGVTELGHLDVVLAGRFFDDPGVAGARALGKWEVALYIDERADRAQGASLEAIFLGRAGGDTLGQFAAAIDTVHAVRRAAIELTHEPRRKRITVADRVRVVGRQEVLSAESVTCAIPGHDHPGQEWVADELSVDEDGLRWQVTGKCGFATDFSYRSTGAEVRQPIP